jgi:CRISPR-associated exonuclease Cas4
MRDVELVVSDFLILLGANNHGKSNILSAIEFGLSTAVKLTSEDFFFFRETGDQVLWVEMVFEQLTEQEKRTFQKYLRNDSTIRLRKSAHLQVSEDIVIAYNGYVQEPAQWWLKGSAFERLSTLQQVEAESINVPELTVLQGGGRVTKQRVQDFQQTYISQHRAEMTFTEILEEGPLLGTKNVAGGVLPELFLVPAVRDLSDETKFKTTTTFGRLLQRAVKEMAEHDPRFIDLRTRLQQIVGDLNARPEGPPETMSELARLESVLTTELTSWGVNVSIQVAPPDLEKVFELGTELHLDDGLKTVAEKKGHGLQRAVIFALIRAWAKVLGIASQTDSGRVRQASESAFFAMEEPELFLHPHAQRQLFTALEEIARVPNHQVFVCTHSTHFVDLEKYRRITTVNKPTAQIGTQVRQCNTDLFEGADAEQRKKRFHMASWVNPYRGEMFFAKKVILVEGETEETVFPFLASKIGVLNPSVSVIDCGSKNNLPLYIAVLNAFCIPYCVVHDEDPVENPIPPDWSPEKQESKQRTFAMNQAIAQSINTGFGSVEVLSPDFEGVCGISHSQAEKKGKALAALDHFDQTSVDAIPPRIVNAVRNAYAVSEGH